MLHLIRTFHPVGHCHRGFHTSAVNCKVPDQTSYFQLLQKILNCKHSNPSFWRDPNVIAKVTPLCYNWRTEKMGEKWENEFVPYQNAISQIIEKTFVKYDPQCESTLEVGSGRFPITRFLSNTSHKDQIHLSEINTQCLHRLQKSHPNNTIRRVDLLSPNQTSRTYQTIVMNDVLNIFSPDELRKALRSIHQLLEPGGRLLHFSIRDSFFTAILDDLRIHKKDYLPIVDEYSTWNGVYVINRERLVDFITAQKANIVKETLREYMSLGPLLQNNLCIDLLTGKNLEMFFDLSKSLEEFQGLVSQKIVFEKEYRNTLQKELLNKDFTVLEFDEVEGMYTGPKREEQHKMWPKHNTFYIKQMLQKLCFDSNIPEGYVQENAVVHVLVAQKQRELI